MNRKNYVWGILLIALGLLLIADKIFTIGFFNPDKAWPIFILVPGLVFELGYFVSRRNPGLLVPGGILTTIGLLFFFENFTGWNFSKFTWPIYPLSVAIGLFQLYLFDGRPRGLLVPVFILTTVAVISFVSIIYSVFDLTLIFAAFAIFAGLYMLYKTFTAKK